MANSKYSKKEKLAILIWYRAGNTLVATCKKYGVTENSIPCFNGKLTYYNRRAATYTIFYNF